MADVKKETKEQKKIKSPKEAEKKAKVTKQTSDESDKKVVDKVVENDVDTKNLESTEKADTKPSNGKKKFYAGTGRRKESVARVWLYDEKGEFIVNGKPIKEYFTSREETLEWVKPFHAIGISHPQSKFSASIKVHGGGRTGQLGAVRLGLSRALVDLDSENKGVLRTADLLTRDSRKVERKKAFFRKARKKPQYSKR